MCFCALVVSACRSSTVTQAAVSPEATPTHEQSPDLPTPSPPPGIQPSPTDPVIPLVTSEPYEFVLDGSPTDIAYLVPLTVQHVGETNATLSFELSEPHEGVLFFWDVAGPAREIPFSGETSRHIIKLNDLGGGVEYWAVVGLKDDTGAYSLPWYVGGEWGEVRFRTFSPDDEPFRVAVVGDSGFGQEATFRLLEQMATFDLDFVLHTGDVVYNIYDDPDAPTSFAWKYYSTFAPILHRMPVFPVIGNHDVERATLWDGISFYFYAFPRIVDPLVSGSSERREWYSFSVGSYQFIMLNSQAFYGSGRLTAQTEWLAERLRDDRFSASIPVFHIAPYTSGMHTNDGVPMRSKWGSYFEQAQVPLVLSGHDHNYERLIVNDVTYVVSGGGSSTLYSLRELLPNSKTFARRTHFVLLELYSDHIELTSVALDGEILDRATIHLVSK